MELQTRNDPLGIIGKWYKSNSLRAFGLDLLEVVKYESSDVDRHYYKCYRYSGEQVTEQVYFFPWSALEQLEM